jgi:hypothetical protein
VTWWCDTRIPRTDGSCRSDSTDSGRALIDTARARVRDVEERMISGLSTDQVQAFVDMLDACASTLDRSSTWVVSRADLIPAKLPGNDHRPLRPTTGRKIHVESGPHELVLRPVSHTDLAMLRRFAVEPHLIGPDWTGFRDPGSVQRRFETDSYLGEDDGRLSVSPLKWWGFGGSVSRRC